MLETTFRTDTGTVTLVDLMPTADWRADLVRRVTGVKGTVRMRHEWIVRTDYGEVRPWVRRRTIGGERVITATAGPDTLVLRGPRLPSASDGRHVDEFDVSEGHELTFATTWVPSYVDEPDLVDIDDQIESLPAGRGRVDLRRTHGHPARRRRAQVPADPAAAHPRADRRHRRGADDLLPEDFGGERNWDYRFCWLRDAALTLQALLAAGYTDEVKLWRDWLLRAVAGDPEDLQIMYAVDGSRRLPERTLDHLPGYAGSRPVRIGNGAAVQRQTDVLGEVMIALERARAAGVQNDDDAWSLMKVLLKDLADSGRSLTTASGRSAASHSCSPTPGRWRGRRSTVR